jgi:DNA-binding FrmR family transcriptional regulator
MKYGYYDNKAALLQRLKRAEGQLRGVAGMIEKDEYCIDILTQVKALQTAVDKVALMLVRDHARHCMADGKTQKEQDQKADELVGAIGRLISR